MASVTNIYCRYGAEMINFLFGLLPCNFRLLNGLWLRKISYWFFLVLVCSGCHSGIQ